MNKFTIFLFLCCFASYAQQHNAFSKVLTKHVSNQGWVNYDQLVDEKSSVSDYLAFLSNNVPKESASKDVKLSFYINLYNAATLFLVVDNYPVQSIKDIGGLFQSPFKLKFILLGEEIYSLDDIEKGILIPINEPRIHFAINCASYSCPKLLSEAFEASTLDSQLEKVTKEFINSNENKITSSLLQLSKIFQWYKSDFETDNQTLIDFLNQYSNIKILPNAKISYQSYNWDLNTQ